MSDATLPTLRPTRSETDPRPAYSSVPSSSESDVYPFVVHSQHSIISGEAPEVDEGKPSRQKRKRTSPEDQAALEAEYKRNSKPDKAARVEILKTVSLGEKEVQIWFQNRRQNTRRKTRPLLPHEIAAFGLGGMATLSSSPVLGIGHGVKGTTEIQNPTRALEVPDGSQERCHSSDSSQDIQQIPMSPEERQAQCHPDIPISSPKLINTLTDAQSKTYVQFSARHDTSHSILLPERLPGTFGYLSSRRNARPSSLSAPQSSSLPTFTANPVSNNSPPSSCPERFSATKVSQPSSSQVRLSLSLDGKAELISSQLSPPPSQHMRALSSSSTINQPHMGLKRSQSDITSGQAPPKSSSQMPLIARTSSGRSRDARTWEFCCDTDARDELTTQAENESSGSAVAAISLLRSTSIGNLKSSINKRNAPAPKRESNFPGKKPKLGRASSSLARLQGSDKAHLGSPSGDSDKENWLPQDGSGNSQRRNLALPRPRKQKRRPVLEESKTGSTHASVLGGHKVHGKLASTEMDVFEDPMTEREVGREVGRFIRREVSPSKKGDLDCIQGLLSLSRGTWR